jgi:hypothetical protein
VTSPYDRHLLEGEWMRQVTDLADVLGWTWAHFRPAKTAHGWRTPVSGTIGKGWPDLTLVRERDHRIVFAELKREGKHPDPDQQVVLDRLRAAGLEVHVWRPSDFAEVQRVLG